MWEEKKLKLELEIERLNKVINNIEHWGAYAESLQRDYDYLIQTYNKHLKAKV